MTELRTVLTDLADNGRPPVSTNGSNRLLAEDRSIHDWYRFVLSYPPHLVRDYVSKFRLGSGHCVLDPFCGTGTTLVECKKLGIASIGIEPNPMACFASRVKACWTIDPRGLLQHAQEVAEGVSEELAASGTYDGGSLPLFEGSRRQMAPPVLRTLPEESHKLLITNSINPVQTHRTLVLLEHLGRRRDNAFRDHELLALARALVTSISNLHFGPEVGVREKREDAPVVDSWLQCVRAIAMDLSELKDRADAVARVHAGDSRDVSTVLDPMSVDAVITSPPYPNEKDYTRTTRLESVFLGLIKDRAGLREFKKRLLRSNTRNVYIGDDDDRWVANVPEIQQIAAEIEARRLQLGKTSGFERMYNKVAKLYFGGMARHLAELRPVLRPGAHLAYVVGDQASYLRVMIRTGQILGRIAESLGYELLGIDLFRERLATATKEWLREEIVVLRWPGGGARQGAGLNTRGNAP
jgi:DNA modification methylase